MIAREEIEAFAQKVTQIREEIAKEIVGQQEVVEQLLITLIAGGNALLEGVPGLGKTRLVRTLAQVFRLPFNRIQFTPDLMPSDITGTNLIVKAEGGNEFRFRPGPVFASVVLADEINRATPKTQSALLEAMQEHSVTVAGETHALPEPFFVLATQNPIEQEGTYPCRKRSWTVFCSKFWCAIPAWRNWTLSSASPPFPKTNTPNAWPGPIPCWSFDASPRKCRWPKPFGTRLWAW